ncbi:ParB/RepB/Spo0J family partition protein [Sphingopyxis terrae]|uniref:Chromosome partitioning protein, ParB family n=1 Tax=Sphingopyxis terrae subsp. ummariensis TaxID=429001 RepID=A0A1Y6FU38_9SPHN|nr:ParB/RepB/Spo0J family partition protein [Sphingopyxis terrae]PCF90980.1 chromosome partitioning protein ParB [Sphingopyxis terrae subsp. ummariensis]SMQ76402.1 chromosome partitioning protein, ParB family [Sphingopyxis terrae subsp. ummariensis]
MKLDFLDLDKLSIAKTNMRGKGKDPDIADILPSIAKRGILVPLLVRPSGSDGDFEIVAGRRRFTAANAILRKGGAVGPVPCAILDDGDDADALEASMLENLARVAPDEVGQWEAFVALIKAGRSAQEVADTFGFEPAAVKRILALGNLVPRIRTLYRGGAVDAATVRHLTLASKSQQSAWLALFDDAEAYCPTGHQLKAWLFGGAAIAVSRALFDVAASDAAIVADLFGEESFFADSDRFWTLQLAEIEARKAAYIEAGWSDVVVMAKGDWFRTWDHVHVPKRKGGRVYVEVRDNGEVSFHEGYLTAKEAARGERAADGAASKPVRPEVTSAMNAYIDLHRHAAVRADLARHGGVALRAMLAHVMAGCGHYRVDVEAQRAPKEEIAESVETAPAEAAFDAQRRAVLGVMGFGAETPTVTGVPGHRPPFAAVFARLLELPDPLVLEIVAVVMGETLMAGHEAVEAIGTHLGTDMRRHWRADAAFFGQLRDREVLLAIVGEIAGDAVATANAEEKAKALKAIIADHLGGTNGRAEVAPWAPRWMTFPPDAYTARGGVGSVRAHARWCAELEDGIDAEVQGETPVPDIAADKGAEVPALAA